MFDAKLDLWSNFTLVHLIDGFLGTKRSVLFVLVVGVIIADEGKLSDLVLLHDERFDMSEWFEKFNNIFLLLVKGDVFHIDVVDQTSKVAAVFWLELLREDTILELLLKGALCCSLILEANETIASGAEVWVQRDLETLDLTKWLKKLMQVLVLHFLWHFDEDVVVRQLVLVATKELLVEWECTTLFVSNIEVFHLLTGIVELFSVFDTDHSGAEWSGEVSLDLWF